MVYEILGVCSERSSAWLEHLLWEQDVAGSNPVAPTIFLPRAEGRQLRIQLFPLRLGKLFGRETRRERIASFGGFGIAGCRRGRIEAISPDGIGRDPLA